MKCPDCNGKSYVEKTQRINENKNHSPMVKKRRRVCRDCHDSFYTYEVYRNQFIDLKNLSESVDKIDKLDNDKLRRSRLKSKNKKDEKK